MSTSGYRRLLRSINYAFSGDRFAITEAKKHLKAEFVKNKHSTDLESHLRDIADVDEMLRFHIVQGKKSTKGNFEVQLKEEHQTTIAAGQDLQHGPELEPIDPSYVGRTNSVLVSKTKADRKPFTKDIV